MSKIIFLSCVLVVTVASFSCYSQKYYAQNESFLEPILVNPAMVGVHSITDIKVMYTRQNISPGITPKYYHLSGQIRLGKYDTYNPKMLLNKSKFRSNEKVGLAAGIYSDNIGPFAETNGVLSYSYHIKINEKANISFGLSGKINQFSTRNQEINARDQGDEKVQFENSLSLSFNTGVFFQYDNFYSGLSGFDILSAFENMNFYQTQPKMYILTGYTFINEVYKIYYEPSVIYSFDPKSSHQSNIDFHSKIGYQNKLWIGLSYLNLSRMGFHFSMNLYKSYYVTYKYASGITNSEINDIISHGILIGKKISF